MHLLILLFFVDAFKEVKFPPPQAQDKKISLNIQQVVTPPAPKPKPIPKPVVKPPQPIVTPPIPKPIVEKKRVPKPEVQPIKKKILDEKKKVFAEKSTEENNVTKIEPKPKKKIVKKEEKKKPAKKVVKKEVKKVEKKRVVKKTKPRKKPKRSNDMLANALMSSATFTSPASRSSSSGGYASRMINQLYGKEFDTYSPTQKKFIKNNLGTIHRITQRTLTQHGYPEVAIRTQQQGTNTVSFYLHPNGDITGLKLKRHIGYEALDQNTLDVIRIAYKDYPLPNKKTKIMFHVTYSMY